MKVLGIDPGSHRTGWGVVSAEGTRLTHVASGVLLARGDDAAARLRSIADALDEVLCAHPPDAVSVETVFYAKNVQSALVLGQARGVALLSAARAGAAVFEYTAGQIKQAVTGRGRAEKGQVQLMVRLLLGLDEPMVFDTSDALAAAICHAHMYATPQSTFLRTVEAAHKRGRRARGGP